MIHVTTFSCGSTRYTYWRHGTHSLAFVVDNGVLFANADFRGEVQINNAAELVAWLLDVLKKGE